MLHNGFNVWTQTIDSRIEMGFGIFNDISIDLLIHALVSILLVSIRYSVPSFE